MNQCSHNQSGGHGLQINLFEYYVSLACKQTYFPLSLLFTLKVTSAT